MGLFDSISEGSFKKLRDGRTAFYPHLVGRGYVVSEEQRIVLSRYVSRAMIIILALMTFFSLFGTVLMILFGSLFAAGYYFRLWRLTRNLERAPDDKRLTLRARYRTQAQHLDWPALLFAECVAGLFVLAGFYIIASAEDSYARILGVMSVLFFGLCAWAGAYMLRAKATLNHP